MIVTQDLPYAILHFTFETANRQQTETSVLTCRTAWLRKDLHVVLVHPQIPQNTGGDRDAYKDAHGYRHPETKMIALHAWGTVTSSMSANGLSHCLHMHVRDQDCNVLCAGTIARTCAATGVGLHLVGPLGFEIDSSRLKRAGLDYWPYVAVDVYSTWQVSPHALCLRLCKAPHVTSKHQRLVRAQ